MRYYCSIRGTDDFEAETLSARIFATSTSRTKKLIKRQIHLKLNILNMSLYTRSCFISAIERYAQRKETFDRKVTGRERIGNHGSVSNRLTES